MNKELRIYEDKDGKMQATFAKSEKPEDEICDFCMGPGPFKVYLCKEFEIGPYNLLPEWNACPACAKLIDAEDRAGLLMRSWTLQHGHPDYIPGIKMIQSKFFENLLPTTNQTKHEK
jgi:hypothetical protein